MDKKNKFRELWEEIQLITIAKGIVIWIFTLVPFVYAYVEQINVIDYIYNHPYRVIISILVVTGGGIFISRAIYAFQKNVQLQAIVEGAGLTGFSLHDGAEEKSHDWAHCEEILSDDQNIKLKILGANGRDTFGKADAPLHKLVGEFKGRIEILLMHPSCEAFKTRTSSLGANHDEYLGHLRETLDFCAYLHTKRNKHITVKLYSQPPIWKMLITNKYMWLQYYSPLKHVENTPVYTFYSDERGTSLFIPLAEVFRKRWQDDGSCTVDLKKYSNSTDKIAFLKVLPTVE
jgi:hypothetical protein